MEQIDYQSRNPEAVDDDADVNQSENADQAPPRIVILWDLLKVSDLVAVSFRLHFKWRRR